VSLRGFSSFFWFFLPICVEEKLEFAGKEEFKRNKRTTWLQLTVQSIKLCCFGPRPSSWVHLTIFVSYVNKSIEVHRNRELIPWLESEMGAPYKSNTILTDMN